MKTDIVVGSLGAVAQQNNKSIAETFINADCIVIVDTSYSMTIKDSRGSQSRYDVACEELESLQNHMPGKIAVLSFSSDVAFCPNGIPLFLAGGTNLTKALEFAKVADVHGMRFVLISDGEPDNQVASIHVASQYENKIDVVYVGPEARPAGRDFLNKLAQASGGKLITCDRVENLESGIQALLAERAGV